jgi:signal transduction histidine kinase
VERDQPIDWRSDTESRIIKIQVACRCRSSQRGAVRRTRAEVRTICACPRWLLGRRPESSAALKGRDTEPYKGGARAVMTDFAEGPTHTGVRRILGRWNLEMEGLSVPVLRYGFPVVCVLAALGLALALPHYKFIERSPFFNLSIALTAWYAGVGPSVLAVVLSTACFSYFFAEPIYALYFVTWAAVVASFVAVRRRREFEIGRLNQELVKRAAELEASNKELEAFAYSASHDLRAPLRHVISYAELLQKPASLLDDRSQRQMKRILEAAKRMANLIDDLLAFSRIGRAETSKTTVDLGYLFREVVAEFEEDTSGRDIGWKVGALPVCHGDRSMLKLVLTNLISNAVKFTRMRTRAEIEIGCADGKNEIEVFVRDNGAGFDMQYAHKLFGVFQRLHRSREFEGTGIGLATVQRVIERHGGRVRCEGALDQGATFYFSLPKV